MASSTSRVSPSATEMMARVEPTRSMVSIKHHDQAVDSYETDVGSGNISMDRDVAWIRRYIKRRECKRFVPRPKKDDSSKTSLPPLTHVSRKSKPSDPGKEICFCGYAKSQHSPAAKASSSLEKWDADKDTETLVTNAFGEIEFPGFGDNVSKYVRVDHRTKMSAMKTLLVDRWNLTMPNLLISVTGGAKNFHMKTRLKEVFRRGLMKAALSTGAWIVTGGTNAGVMKHVGEAVRDFGLTAEAQGKVICIGIAPWGCVQDKDDLIDQWSKPNPACHRVSNIPKPKQSFLDPNHSHFILVDNGTQLQFGTEIDFRGAVENKISNERTSTGSGVPVVQLVLEGGPGTLKTCMTAIHNNTPAVIIKGSGRAADILAFAYQNSVWEEITVEDKAGNKVKKTQFKMDDSVKADIAEMIQKEFGKKDMEQHVSYVLSCVQKQELMTIFELDSRNSTRDVDMAILKALLKANSEEVMDQLKLALAWNRIDVAKSEIFTDSREWKMGQLDQMMMTAIQLNRIDFVDLFLDHGVSLRDFLTPQRLLTLYNTIPRNYLLHSLLAKVHGKSDKKKLNLVDVGKLLQNLIGDYYKPYYITREMYRNLDVDRILRSEEGSCQELELHRPIQELFIWSVLMNRQSLAKLFWREGNEQVAGALVANSILKALKNHTDDAELMSKFQQNADEWESLAIGVLNSCYNADEQKAQDLLIRELENWGQATSVLIAVEADNKKFVSQTACQSLLNNIWMGQMSLDNGKIKLVSSIFLFPLIWWIIRFREEEKAKFDALLSSQSENKKQGTNNPVTRELTRENTMLGDMKRENTRLDLKDGIIDEQQKQQETQTHKINPLKKLYLFYTAPVIIFSLNVISYLLFLGIYSYILLIEFQPRFSVWEGLLIGWVFTIMVEEFRQLMTNNATSFKSKFSTYVTDSWNILDILTIVLFIVGMILRFIPNPTCFEVARVVLCVNLISFFLRILHIFSVNKQLGPKLVMIRRMIEDLMSFVVILMVFIVAYAIASESILYPNQILSLSLLYDIPRKAYWTIYGELFLENIEGTADCTSDPLLYLNGTMDRCPTEVGKYLVPVLMGIYILLTNVLLLNLLIAMFSYTFQHIQDNTELYWYFQRFQLIIEYHSRPALPPPLIVIIHFYYMCKCCFLRCRNNEETGTDLRKRYENKLEEKQLVQWENVLADTYLMKTEESENERIEHKVMATLARLDALSTKVDDMQDSQLSGGAVISGEISSIINNNVPNPALHVPPELEERLKVIEGQMVQTYKALNWIMMAMSKNFLPIGEDMPQLPDPEQEIKKRQQLELEEIQRDRELVQSMRVHRYKHHFESRVSPYPGSRVVRCPVPNEKVAWDVPYPEYEPVQYTSSAIKDQSWADPDLMEMPVEKRNIITFNKYDKKYQVDRTSHMGKYKVVNGIPLNPRGRTGIVGRGSLGRWGPNHAGDPVVTRWKVDDKGNKIQMNGKPLLEFVVVQRSDNKLWALPGAICEPGQKVWDILKTDFSEEALGSLMDDPQKKTAISEKIEQLSKLGQEVYRDYADDSRNTDNAWLESRVVNYHDEEGTILGHFTLRAGDMVDAATWQTMSSSLSLHGSHSYFCQLVAEKLGAYF